MNKKLSTVLLVDDSDATNNLTSIYLDELEFCEKIEVKKNGEEALQYLKSCKKPPELILLDVNMPVMDGFEFLEAYEDLPDFKKNSILIIVLTSSSNPNESLRARENPWVKDFYQKPIDQDSLIEIRENHFTK